MAEKRGDRWGMVRKCARIIILLILLTCNLSFSGCSLNKSLIVQDEENIRSMFHVDPEVDMIIFDSAPKEADWFGREGLHIYAVFQFNNLQFTEYMRIIEDADIWHPVEFIGRSPKIDRKFSDESCEWKTLPFSSNVWGEEANRKFFLKQDMEGVKKGMYYCTISHLRYDDNPVYFMRYSSEESTGISDRDSESRRGFARILGVLDTENKRLYAEYQM